MKTERPSILLLVGEDTGRHMGCYGDAFARTPTLDSLADEGARFERAFSHAPVCAPSRGSIVSGQYPYSLGIHLMRSRLLQPPRIFTHELVDAGYDVFWPGKLDFNFEPTPGWCTSTDSWWETGLPRDRPFFAYCNYFETHESQMWHDPESKAGSPSAVGGIAQGWPDPDAVPVPPYLPDLPEVRLQLARYYARLQQQDKHWARCLQALKDSGQAERTIVIYLSDHGRGLPREKRWCYEAGIHLPLIVRWPGRIDPGSVRDDIVSWVDLAPSLLRAAGISVPQNYQGVDFLSKETPAPRLYHFAGRDRMDEAFDCQRVCRSRDWLYVRNYFPEIPFCRRVQYQEQAPAVVAMREANARAELSWPGNIWFQSHRSSHELYYLPDDPHCLHNLAQEADYAAELQLHQAALSEHLQAVGDYGARIETDLVSSGLIADSVAEYTQRLAALPEHLAPESPQASILMPRPRDDAQKCCPPLIEFG